MFVTNIIHGKKLIIKEKENTYTKPKQTLKNPKFPIPKSLTLSHSLIAKQENENTKMVVIKVDESEERDSRPSRPSPSVETTSESAPSGSGNADDGFETASDGELADGDDQRSEDPPLQEQQSNVSDDELREV